MTPEEWADALIDISPHPQEPSVLILADGRRAPLDDRSLVDYSTVLGRLARDTVAGVIRLAVAEALSAGLPGAPLSAEQLAMIDARLAAVTPGEWCFGTAAEGMHQDLCHYRNACHNVFTAAGDDVTLPCAGLSAEDAAFVARAPADIRALRAHADHLNALFRDLAGDDGPGMAGPVNWYGRGYADGRAELLGLLRELEWCAHRLPDVQPPGQVYVYTHLCPACREQKPGPHKDGCRLAKILADATAAPGEGQS